MAARQDGGDFALTVTGGLVAIISTPVRKVFINGVRPAALGSSCEDGSVVNTASPDVFYEGHKAARVLDRTTTGLVVTSSPDVLVNNR